ncbi:hypothetical protein TRAPUB_12774 [Trametes pubescens]|uniref:Uncharacterized protein n=1 Tax=Trametes pubescens TaxID=154538 RepID=A0A1M2VT21_TRAPU|nr:hypothetical protein TRAPUB_12774 [Trametes pubescens]
MPVLHGPVKKLSASARRASTKAAATRALALCTSISALPKKEWGVVFKTTWHCPHCNERLRMRVVRVRLSPHRGRSYVKCHPKDYDGTPLHEEYIAYCNNEYKHPAKRIKPVPPPPAAPVYTYIRGSFCVDPAHKGCDLCYVSSSGEEVD